MPEAQQDFAPSFPIGEAAPYRAARRIEPFITDYMSDEVGMTHAQRVAYLQMLKKETGVESIRTEIRMNKLINSDGSFNEEMRRSYKDSLVAMKETGFESPTLVLFTPAPWMKDLAKKNPTEFNILYKKYVGEVLAICKEAGVTPKYLQVMNEVNTMFQTQISSPRILDMIRSTDAILRERMPETKILTTINTDVAGWQAYTEKLVGDAGPALAAIGFDHYPFWHPSEWVLAGNAFRTFRDTQIYEWIIQQKIGGVLKDKNVQLAELGMPDLPTNEDFQRRGLDRMMQTLDHLLLKYQRQGYKAEDLFSAIGFFEGGNFPSIVAKFPGRLDVTPFTLIQKNREGQWKPTFAGNRIRDFITTRINPNIQTE